MNIESIFLFPRLVTAIANSQIMLRSKVLLYSLLDWLSKGYCGQIWERHPRREWEDMKDATPMDERRKMSLQPLVMGITEVSERAEWRPSYSVGQAIQWVITIHKGGQGLTLVNPAERISAWSHELFERWEGENENWAVGRGSHHRKGLGTQSQRAKAERSCGIMGCYRGEDRRRGQEGVKPILEELGKFKIASFSFSNLKAWLVSSYFANTKQPCKQTCSKISCQL